MSCLTHPSTSWTYPQGIGVCQDQTKSRQYKTASYNVSCKDYVNESKLSNYRLLPIFTVQSYKKNILYKLFKKKIFKVTVNYVLWVGSFHSTLIYPWRSKSSRVSAEHTVEKYSLISTLFSVS